MPCYHPIQIPVAHKPTFPGGPATWIERTLPCGRCLGCRATQARDWATRLMNEQQMHQHSWFVTLTYDEENLPEHGTLNPRHLQGFIKALRRDHPPGTISYYACGEYGERSARPHYHAVLYGPGFLDRYRWRTNRGHHIWRSDALEHYWKRGASEFSAVTYASALYCAGYVRKKLSIAKNPDAYTRVDPNTGELVQLQQEFARMSLKPAIGKRWIEKYWREVYPRDQIHLTGRTVKPPRYYDKWMDENHPEIMFQVRFKRDQEATYLDQYTLASKQAHHEARVSLYQQRSQV